MSKRTAILATTCAASVFILAACGSSAKPAATRSTTSTSHSSTAGSTRFVAGRVPAVSGATDLTSEPTVAKGESPAPAVLTGKDLVVGTGASAVLGDTVKVQYVGVLYSTGKVFDASWTDSGPATFPLSGVIPGFRDAIVGMKVGGRREIVIPPADGYGAAGQPPTIPGNATLVFVIDLLAVT
jgi:peptidylprolyl isomerase